MTDGLRSTDRSNPGRLPPRSDRMFHENGLWYFHTREGRDIGPFRYRHEAESMLQRYIAGMQATQSSRRGGKLHFRVSATAVRHPPQT